VAERVRTGGALLKALALDREGIGEPDAHPFDVPALRQLDELAMAQPVTCFVGENGSGKSTLVEAIAVSAGLNAEGGSRNLRFATRPSHSTLHEHLRLSWGQRPQRSFFLRAESFYTTASAYEEVGLGGYHERSHGESFLDVATHQFQPGGFYVMDEPESALSVRGQLTLLRRMHDLTAAGAQFVMATHSPVLLAFPGTVLYALDDDGVRRVGYEDTDPFVLTKAFLEGPDRFFRHLFSDDDDG
jgi:predicted ATPase